MLGAGNRARFYLWRGKMTDILNGKGMYIHKIKDVEGGDGKTAATEAYNAGLTHILIKILDGPWEYNQRPIYSHTGKLTGWEDDILGPFIEPFQAHGIEVWGWQYVYHRYPKDEAMAAHERVEKFGLNGFIIDAESQAKRNAQYAGVYMNNLVGLRVPVGLSSYRYPELHPELNWKVYFAGCDLVMPQVYWQGASNSGEQLSLSHQQYIKITNLPYYPTGSAYCEHGWCATPGQVEKFMITAEALKMPAVNFWDWRNARAIPGMWDAISVYDYGDTPEPPPIDPPVEDSMVLDSVAHMVDGKKYVGSAVLYKRE